MYGKPKMTCFEIHQRKRGCLPFTLAVPTPPLYPKKREMEIHVNLAEWEFGENNACNDL
jgi:hypothetical protein